MIEREATWAEVEPGVVVQAPDLKHYLVCQEKVADGVRWVQLMDAHKGYRASRRPADSTPVTIMETTEPEAILLLGEQLGASILRKSNQDTLPVRAMKFRCDPLPTGGRGAKDSIHSHIDMTHGVYVGDGSTKRTVAEALAIHDEMHTPGPIMTMVIPHYHDKEGH